MKQLSFIVIIIIFSVCECTAQTITKIDSMLRNMMNQEEPAMPTSEVINHIDSDVYIYDDIADYRIINDSLKLLYIGHRYPNQQLTILIKGKKVNKELSNIKTGKLHFSGKAIMYKGKPAIIVTNAAQLGTRIQI